MLSSHSTQGKSQIFALSFILNISPVPISLLSGGILGGRCRVWRLHLQHERRMNVIAYIRVWAWHYRFPVIDVCDTHLRTLVILCSFTGHCRIDVITLWFYRRDRRRWTAKSGFVFFWVGRCPTHWGGLVFSLVTTNCRVPPAFSWR